MVGLYAEPLPKGFGFSDTAFRVFILMASRRLKSDRFFTSDYNAETYTQTGLDWIDETTMIDVLKRHYPELAPALRGVDNAFAPWTRTGAPAVAVRGELAAFLGIAILVIVTPGQDTALTIRNTLLGGRRGGVATALGVVVRHACWTVAASVGLAALLVASEPVFVALKLAGAAYLVYLGLQALRHAIRRARRRSTRRRPRRSHRERAFRQGLLSNLGNPKIAVFFTSLLPQFGSSFWSLLALGLLFCSLDARLAVRVLVRRRARRRPAAATADPAVARRAHRDAPRRLRDPARRGPMSSVSAGRAVLRS